MKRIVICLDGTWQTLAQDEPTNISIISRSLAHTDTSKGGPPIPQVVIYNQGVGATIGTFPGAGLPDKLQAFFTRVIGGAFGSGLDEMVFNTYLQLVLNYEDGDEIYIFGFSRGAFAARRLAGLLNSAGVVSRMHAAKALAAFQLYQNAPDNRASEEQRQAYAETERAFRLEYGKGARNPDGSRRPTAEPPPIRFLGVFDTVAQRSVGEVIAAFLPQVRRRRKFKNLRVCPNVRSAFHAVAIDECRVGFPPRLWEGLEDSNKEAWAREGADPNHRYFDQRWFVGMHGDVGGGDSFGLSLLALKWITDGAAAQGLRFYQKHGPDESPLGVGLHGLDAALAAPVKRPSLWKSLQPIHYQWRPRRIWSGRGKPKAEDAQFVFDPSVAKRWTSEKRYRPGPLRPFKTLFDPPKTPGKKKKEAQREPEHV